jgi:hypothetical protein
MERDGKLKVLVDMWGWLARVRLSGGDSAVVTRRQTGRGGFVFNRAGRKSGRRCVSEVGEIGGAYIRCRVLCVRVTACLVDREQ